MQLTFGPRLDIMKEVRDSMKVRKRNNQYFLIVETMGDQIKPKDPSLFHLTINHYTRFDHIYTFCPEEIGNRLSDIDRELLKYDCMEHFIDQYFTSYDPFEDQYKAFVRIELFKKKQKQRIDIEPLYHDYMMEEILESMDSKNETIPMLADSFLHYKEQFMNDITVTPAEIIIPAGELESADITWSITDAFLLTTADPETYTLVVTASAESEDPVVVENKEENFLTFNVNKVFRNFGYISDKITNWVELDKTGWSVELDPGLRQNGNLLIDGKGGSGGNSVYRSADWWFVVDMKSEKTMTGFGIDYYENGTPSSPKKVTISTKTLLTQLIVHYLIV